PAAPERRPRLGCAAQVVASALDPLARLHHALPVGVGVPVPRRLEAAARARDLPRLPAPRLLRPGPRAEQGVGERRQRGRGRRLRPDGARRGLPAPRLRLLPRRRSGLRRALRTPLRLPLRARSGARRDRGLARTALALAVRGRGAAPRPGHLVPDVVHLRGLAGDPRPDRPLRALRPRRSLARRAPRPAARRGGPPRRPRRAAPAVRLPGAALNRAGRRRARAAVRRPLRAPRGDRGLRPALRGRLSARDRRAVRDRRRGHLVGPVALPRAAARGGLDLCRLRPLLPGRADPRPALRPAPAARGERRVPAAPLARPPLLPRRRPARPGVALGPRPPPGDPERRTFPRGGHSTPADPRPRRHRPLVAPDRRLVGDRAARREPRSRPLPGRRLLGPRARRQPLDAAAGWRRGGGGAARRAAPGARRPRVPARRRRAAPALDPALAAPRHPPRPRPRDRRRRPLVAPGRALGRGARRLRPRPLLLGRDGAGRPLARGRPRRGARGLGPRPPLDRLRAPDGAPRGRVGRRSHGGRHLGSDRRPLPRPGGRNRGLDDRGLSHPRLHDRRAPGVADRPPRPFGARRAAPAGAALGRLHLRRSSRLAYRPPGGHALVARAGVRRGALPRLSRVPADPRQPRAAPAPALPRGGARELRLLRLRPGRAHRRGLVRDDGSLADRTGDRALGPPRPAGVDGAREPHGRDRGARHGEAGPGRRSGARLRDRGDSTPARPRVDHHRLGAPRRGALGALPAHPPPRAALVDGRPARRGLPSPRGEPRRARLPSARQPRDLELVPLRLPGPRPRLLPRRLAPGPRRRPAGGAARAAPFEPRGGRRRGAPLPPDQHRDRGLLLALPEDLAYTLGWALFAIALFVAGIVRPNQVARIAAIVLLLVAVLKGFVHDMARLGGLYRVGSFAGLGVCLALMAVLIQKYVLPRREAK